MSDIFQMKRETDRFFIRDLFWEYHQWANEKAAEEFDVDLDSKAMLEQDMANLDKCAAPKGRLLMAQDNDAIVGIACLREIDEGVAEIKRMYVRPEHRGSGIGRTLLEHLLDEARQIGYDRVRLNSASFMEAARYLFQSAGFKKIDSYPQTEIPKELHENWIFMELLLDAS